MDCTICLIELQSNDVTTIKCGHIFHTECIDAWAAKSEKKYAQCPNCRQKFKKSYQYCLPGQYTLPYPKPKVKFTILDAFIALLILEFISLVATYDIFRSKRVIYYHLILIIITLALMKCLL